MAKISATEVAKLRKMTGAGMMDCKTALEETNGDFDAAIDILRKKGQKLASKRADREATEGAVLAKVSADNKTAVIISLNCETDFVAKNADFVAFAQQILDLAVANLPESLDALKELILANGSTIADEITNQIGVIGEKIDLGAYERVSGESAFAYIHTGNKLSSIVALNMEGIDVEVGKNVAMQIAAMSPIAIDKDDVPKKIIDKEIEIGKELAIQEGKPADMAEKIAIGRLNKFFQESTLLNQAFVRNNKETIKQYLQSINKDLTVVAFNRYGI
jgi:elongation factor Ts